MVEHLSGYQNRDREIADYHMYSPENTGLWFRGPPPASLTRGEYIVCLGAAQTFGCLCEKPYPQLLQEITGCPVLNLGYGGAGPSFFTKHASLWPLIQNAKLAIVQIMSGRSVDNSLFESGGLEYLRRRSDGTRLSAEAAYTEVLNGPSGQSLSTRFTARAFRRLRFEFRRQRARRLVQETRRNWQQDYKDLLDRIRIPKVLLWFSRRVPDYEADYRSVHTLFGEFPQLVDRHMMNEVTPRADSYVECVTSRGTPQLLISRFTGHPVAINPYDDRPDFGSYLMTHNIYYPTPEMHEDAANALVAHCK